MRIILFLISAFILSVTCSTFAQEPDSLMQTTNSEEESKPWFTSPSLRWNTTGLGNPWFPAASIVFEYPFNKIIGLEVEGGVLMPHTEVEFEGEKFSGFRARIAPKIYLVNDESNLMYLRLQFKYDYAETLDFRTILDPSGSFQEDRLVEGKLENIGYIIFAGYMTSFLEEKFVLDVSLGVGGTRWDEQLSLPDGSNIIIERRLFQRNNLQGSLPVIAFNLQLGYMF